MLDLSITRGGFSHLTLYILRSKFGFSFVAPIYFAKKKWGEVDKISSKFILSDHIRNSHDHSVLQSIDITRRKFLLGLKGLKKNYNRTKQNTVFNLLFNVFLECRDDIYIKEKKIIRLNVGEEINKM